MTEVSRILRNIYFPKIPPILKLEVGFFSVYIFFRIFFPNSGTFILPKLHICRFKKKSENIFFSFIHSFRLVVREVQVGDGLRAQDSRGQAFLTFSSFFFFFFFSFFFFFIFFFSFFFFFFLFFFFLFSFFFLVAHGFGTERARLVDAACRGASLLFFFFSFPFL